MEIANPQFTFVDIARLTGVKDARYTRLRNLPIYQTIKNQQMTGILTRLDTKVSDSINLTQETLSYAVPLAMQEIVKQALNAKDERIRNKACNDILDRDGHFAKVSRVGLATEQQGGIAKEQDNETARNLISALKSQPALPGPATIDSKPATETTQ